MTVETDDLGSTSERARVEAELGRLRLDRFPRSSAYDPRWMIDNCMGPNPLWLLESLAPSLGLEPGMRVLDLGCGRAMTSIFLAREYGVTVWAADLWVAPSKNLPRIVAAGVEESVFPVLVEAHDLPFADEFFDVIVSVDAYQYFGTADLYLGYVSKFLRTDGRLGIAVPGLTGEIDVPPPELDPWWEWDFMAFHSPAWWRRLWSLSGLVEVELAEAQDGGWALWRLWSDVCRTLGTSDFIRSGSERDVAMLDHDRGRRFCFPLVVARKLAVARSPFAV